MPIIKLNNSIIKLNNSIIFNKDKDPSSIGLIYETDFSNFDVNTGLDIPLYGKPLQYSTYSNVEKTTRTINGETLSCMHMNPGGNLAANLLELNDYDCFSIEFFTNKDSWQGLGCGCHTVVSDNFSLNCQFYNCYERNRGLGLLGFSIPQNDFYSIYWGANAITSNNIDRGNVTRIISGGTTIDKIHNIAKAYICGKKAATRSISITKQYPAIHIYTDSIYETQMNIFKIKIYKNVDIFEQMQ